MDTSILDTWRSLNAGIKNLGEAECIELLEYEVRHKHRNRFMQRLNHRISALRSPKERNTLNSEGQMISSAKEVKTGKYRIALRKLHGVELVFVNGDLTPYTMEQAIMLYKDKKFPCAKTGKICPIKGSLKDFNHTKHFCE